MPETFICWTCGECFSEEKLPPRSVLRDAADREILDKVGDLFKNIHDSTIADLLNIIRDEKEKAFIAGAEWVQKVTRAHVRRQYMRDTARMRYPLW